MRDNTDACKQFGQGCSATIKAYNHETTVRTKDYKNLIKQQERTVKRLKRQIHTYEALATTKFASATTGAPAQTQGTVCFEGETEIQAITKETVKRLWEQDLVSRTRAAELENQLATAKERSKVLAAANVILSGVCSHVCDVLNCQMLPSCWTSVKLEASLGRSLRASPESLISVTSCCGFVAQLIYVALWYSTVLLLQAA
jgi:hypothetical protein